MENANVRLAIDELTRRARFIKVLGSYPSQDLPAPRASTEPEPEEERETESEAMAFTPVPEKKAPAGYRLASREYKSEDTVIDVRGVRIGGEHLVVIAGPCAGEAFGQILAC